MWPLLLESSAKLVWALAFVTVALFASFSYALGRQPSLPPIPSWWGQVIATLVLLQLLVALLLQRRYDRGVLRCLPAAVLYPLVGLTLLSASLVVMAPRALLEARRGRRRRHARRLHAHRPG